jgi:nitroreductase
MEFDNLTTLIKGRRSIRRWQDKEVPSRLLTKAIELAIWAPNGGNRQNWRFYVIVNRNTIESIADRVQNTADQMASWPESQQFANEVSRWRENASFLLLVLHKMGLGAVWMTGPMQAAGEIEKILKVPSDMNLVAFIPVGYPAETPEPRPRRPVEEVCEIIS